MWYSFWKSRDRFSLEELRYLTDQLLKVQIVNEVNKDFVIEALRSIAELITYGDQNDSSFFEYFMEKQVMAEFVRILKITKAVTVSFQLLQTISIMIQNLKSEHAIYYMFSNEHINFLITYSFDFRNEELLSYYISFLRAISGKLNKHTISLLVKTQNEEVTSFPLYDEAIQFAFHEESMIRTAIRALTLNVYHVGDDAVNRYVSSTPHSDYFSKLVLFFRKQCISLNDLVSASLRTRTAESTISTLTAVDEIEDNLYYMSDVISAGIPDVGRLITDHILRHLIFPLLLPSLVMKAINGLQMGTVTSLYLLCCILRIVKIKDLANTVATALLFPLEAFIPSSEAKVNGCMTHNDITGQMQQSDSDGSTTEVDFGKLSVSVPDVTSTDEIDREDIFMQYGSDPRFPFREVLLSYVTNGDDVQVLGSLNVLATLLQTKGVELDESMLDEFGILPQRKQHKKLLLQALVGEGSDEEQLFSSENSFIRDGVSNELQRYRQKLKEEYAIVFSHSKSAASPRAHRFQVLDALVSLLCRSNISADTLWDGGWLLRQLLPYSESEFNIHHLQSLKNSYKNCTASLLQEVRGVWPDLLITVLCDEWKKCKRAIEASSPRKEPKSILFPPLKASLEVLPVESSINAGERLLELVKEFVLLHQLQIFCLGKPLPEQPPIHPAIDVAENIRAATCGLDNSGPKLGTELNLVDGVPCRIAFERGKERHFLFLAITIGASGWIVLAEELPLKLQHGVVRVTAPLAGSSPKIDEKHSRWLHVRIRPCTLPFIDPVKSIPYGKVKPKALVDGRWTLAFKNEESCKTALSMILEESNLQCNEVERRLKPLIDLGITASHESVSSNKASSNSL